MLAIVLALASAIGYGSSDFAAGLASRRAAIIQVNLLASMAYLVVAAAALPFAPSHPPSAAALAWGAGAGLGGTAGGLALYFGFRQAAFSVAGPLSAVGAAGFSVLAGLLFGERPTALAMTGIVLALPAIVGVSASTASAGRDDRRGQGTREPDAAGPLRPDGAPTPGRPATQERPATSGRPTPGRPATQERPATTGRPAAGVFGGLIAGACFALLFIGLDRAGSGSGLWPVAAASAAELAAAFGVATVTGNVRLPRGWPRSLAVIAGASGALGTILYFVATHEGFLAVTAVLTSLYPVVTIVLARTVLGERLTGLRLGGLVLAGACVALIAVGGAG
ncbi:MAG TPA: DMT family transporter [Streptosporangiaceae bacterium]|nr:DMT family transporter [Streptosporangiaceae bacterium]